MLWLALACGGGQTHPSVIDDTSIIAIVTDPAEAAPGETVSITVTVVDPKQRGAVVMIWTCGLYEGACIEDNIDLAERVEIIALPTPETSLRRDIGLPDALRHITDQVSTTRDIPSESGELLGTAGSLPVALYALACPAGVCPIIDSTREALRSAPSDQLLKDLADPTRWMVDLPMEGVSLAIRSFVVSYDTGADRNYNPSFDPRFSAAWDATLRIPTGGELETAFYVTDPNGEHVYGYAYTTIGQFEERRVKDNSGTVRNWLLAPSSPGDGVAYMVFEDRDGGSAVWRQAVEVYAPSSTD